MSAYIITVVHVDDVRAVGRKERCDRFCEDLNRLVPIIPLANCDGMSVATAPETQGRGFTDNLTHVFRGEDGQAIWHDRR